MSDNTSNELITLRKELDAADAQLLRYFTERMDTVRRIGEYKRAHALPVADERREQAKLDSIDTAVPQQLRPNAKRFMRFLMDEAKRLQQSEFNIYLIGMPDCGKTRIGKRLAKRLEMPLVDTDKLIMQRMDMSIDDIFANLGEEAFRSMETMTLVQAAKTGGCIVATGGGMPLWQDNGALIKNSGTAVFLDRKLDSLLGQNVKNRPLLREGGGDVDANIKELYNKRRPMYLELADITVDPDDDNAVERIISLLKERE